MDTKNCKCAYLGLMFLLSAISPSFADDIKVGAALLFSGWGATYGEDARVGIDLGLEEISQSGGVLGRQLSVDYEDTGGDRAKAIAFYRRFASDPNIIAMLSITSIEFVVLDPVANETKLPLISLQSAAPYNNFSPWSFRTTLIVSQAMPHVLSELRRLKGAESIAVVYDAANVYNVSELESVRSAAPKAGLKVTAVESFKTGEQDFTLQLTQIKAANPSILYVAATVNEAALIINQARSLKVNAQILGGAGLADPRVAALPGNAAAGVTTFMLFDENADEPAVKDFLARYKRKFGDRSPPTNVACAYDGIRLLADAIRRAGTTDREQVRTALGSTKGFKGACGSYRYERSGDNLEQAPKLFQYTPQGLKRVSVSQ